jgi:hypothetical protein
MTDFLSTVGTSFDSFADAAASAFEQIPGDPTAEGLASAIVTRLWMSKGGVVGRVQYHAELVATARAAAAEPKESA